MEGKAFLTVEEAAAAKQVHRNSVERALRRGRLVGTRHGVAWVITREALDAWQPVGHRPKKRE